MKRTIQISEPFAKTTNHLVSYFNAITFKRPDRSPDDWTEYDETALAEHIFKASSHLDKAVTAWGLEPDREVTLEVVGHITHAALRCIMAVYIAHKELDSGRD